MNTSQAPFGETLGAARTRLLGRLPKNPEVVMMRYWENVNIRGRWHRSRIPLMQILLGEGDSRVGHICRIRDRRVVAATLQWIATIEGADFLERFEKACLNTIATTHVIDERSSTPFGETLGYAHVRLREIPNPFPNEVTMMRLWETENIRSPSQEALPLAVEQILCEGTFLIGGCTSTKRERQVVAATLQWIATPAGTEFLIGYRKALDEANGAFVRKLRAAEAL